LLDRALRRRGGRVEHDVLRDAHRVLVDRRREHVHRQIEQHRTGRTGGGEAHRLRHEPRNLRRRRDLMRPLHHRPRDRHLIDARLQRVRLGIAQRRRAAQVEHGRAIEIRVGHGGDDVGEARPRGHHGDAERARGARVTFRRVSGRHFMSSVDDRHAVTSERLEDRF
jgi:hypothetical protein